MQLVIGTTMLIISYKAEELMANVSVGVRLFPPFYAQAVSVLSLVNICTRSVSRSHRSFSSPQRKVSYNHRSCSVIMSLTSCCRYCCRW